MVLKKKRRKRKRKKSQHILSPRYNVVKFCLGAPRSTFSLFQIQTYYPSPVFQKICKTKEFSSDTELCTPDLGPICDQIKARVYKIGKAEEECAELKIPKCRVTDEADEVKIWSVP